MAVAAWLMDGGKHSSRLVAQQDDTRYNEGMLQ